MVMCVLGCQCRLSQNSEIQYPSVDPIRIHEYSPVDLGCKGNLSSLGSGFVGTDSTAPLQSHIRCTLLLAPRVSPHLFERSHCTTSLFCGVRSTRSKCVPAVLIFCPEEGFSGCPLHFWTLRLRAFIH